jgi:hypothetical protein
MDVKGSSTATPATVGEERAVLKLVILDGSDRQYVIPEGGELRVGTGAQCTVRLQAEDVSRTHALIAERGGRVVLLDLGSKNGTFLNGRPIREAEVAAGDLVRFSSVPAQLVRSGDEPPEGPAEPPPRETRPAAVGDTDDAIPLAFPAGIVSLLKAWQSDDSLALVSLVLWLVQRRGVQSAAVVAVVGEEVTVAAAHGTMAGMLQDRRCLAVLRNSGALGPGPETSQLLLGDQRVLAISAPGLPWLLVATGERQPEAGEVDLWVHLLAVACRLDHRSVCTSGRDRHQARHR